MPKTTHSPRTSALSGAAARVDDGVDCGLRVPDKAFFSISETAAVLAMGTSYVEKCLDCGLLGAIEHNAGAGVRSTKRIPRAWIVSYFGRTAGFSGGELAAALAGCLAQLSAPQLLNLRRAIDGQLSRIEP